MKLHCVYSSGQFTDHKKINLLAVSRYKMSWIQASVGMKILAVLSRAQILTKEVTGTGYTIFIN